MIGTSEKKIYVVYKMFLPYIEEHPYFDIVYSKKIGFVKLWISESRDEVTRIETWEKLLESLCQEIVLDVVVCSEEKKKVSELIEESCLRIEKILNTAEKDGRELMNYAKQIVCCYFQRDESI